MRMMTRSEFNRRMLRRGGPRLLLLVEESKVPRYSTCVPWVSDLPTYRNFFKKAEEKRLKQDGIMYNHWYNVQCTE